MPRPKESGRSDIQIAGAFADEIFGDGDEQAGAVAAEAVGIHAAAMGKTRESDEGAFDDIAGTLAAELRDEAYPAGIVVHCGLWRRRAHVNR